ncbi:MULTISPECIES: phosphatidylserine/phosphatidylglycerophosphate/cardiolipin synthase family protein [unclassified Janthinobacterium]|uniref:phospholipase D-like domain-containing protein n=1 Tax=unclassified Janthinobacterium TaxID=2610881 RepID=UPI00161694EA|nr:MULTISPECIES: phospholipase D-like domain-containing protein [unclassified Janthinobacterium]MBB5366972.1 phosphatidylserine/phosphatidylglycerophosphate/cardiolipin synthase-like enzyme [Janthinobacterium sp. K2C7]MBB5380550.1 phosphatidylserine/phosphatidylglycerophosphate/cardiolipin synthase-like enzyme [Janthinobacterium sp. K2Li3]MBB5385354.1 phosphatidylserine/phosphatidylglycerophosphate/cardiolipin synthase-like enzyme [Janthinobacterium sp. K2E3]
MPESSGRIETTHIDEVGRSATSSLQWLLENRNLKGKATHPITHNNKLTLFICGQEGFADIAGEIARAEKSIDLCCWGFDPGMELVRGNSATWPRGETFGDLLIAAARRHVRVRLLVWYDHIGSPIARTMPGYSHGTSPWKTGGQRADDISAKSSLAMLQEAVKKKLPVFSHRYWGEFIRAEDIPMKAREEYCHSWYAAAFRGLFGGLEIRLRHGDSAAISKSIATEINRPRGLTMGEIEKPGMQYLGTHHQKPVLIDFDHQEGAKAVGYVMGLNSVTDYWDTTAHLLDDTRRECLQGMAADGGFATLKPYQDYACRIDGGRALIALYNNFVKAWDRAAGDRTHAASNASVSRELPRGSPPARLLREAGPGDSTVQIVLTQPEEQDKTIRESYFRAVTQASLAAGYLYVENQYFQYEDWAQHLLDERKKVVAAWKAGSAKAGKSLEDMPVMHVFIVIPVPERAQMVPRTHDTLAALGQHDGMTGQNKMIDDYNKRPKTQRVRAGFGISAEVAVQLPDVVKHANGINKPGAMTLESEFGLKVSVAMLNVSAFDNDRWRYREIYIHSKLMLVDDVFMTLGSANLNQRSMAVDSEINIATVDCRVARDLRKRVWRMHSGGLVDGGGGTKAEIVTAFKDWTNLMKNNRKKKFDKSENAIFKKMRGFVLPLEDKRSSTIRLG